MRDDRERLLDILEAIERIDRYAVCGREAFEHDELIQNWITTSSRSSAKPPLALPPIYGRTTPEVPWRQIIGMRNVLTHGYFDIDLAIVWSVVERDLGKLRSQVEAILDKR